MACLLNSNHQRGVQHEHVVIVRDCFFSLKVQYNIVSSGYGQNADNKADYCPAWAYSSLLIFSGIQDRIAAAGGIKSWLFNFGFSK